MLLPRIMPVPNARSIADSRLSSTHPGAVSLRGLHTTSRALWARLAVGRYHADGTSTNWCKIKNPAYTQMTARHELFERRTGLRKRRPMLRVP